MPAEEIDRLIRTVGRLPGLGPRSAKRAVLALLKNREQIMEPVLNALKAAKERVCECSICGNLDVSDPCQICSDERRDRQVICVVQDVEDLWALKDSGKISCQFHILGGTLDALEQRSPQSLRIQPLLQRLEEQNVKEVILALGATVEGQTTALYLAKRLSSFDCLVTRLGTGLPVGGELNYLDEGTIEAALNGRQKI